MRRNWLFGGLALATLGLLAWAWIDGGREPPRPMVQTVVLPGAAR
jgi:hypothetical protein